MTSESLLRKIVSYLLIFIQLLTPALTMAPAHTYAKDIDNLQNTIQGLNSLIISNNRQDDRPPHQSHTETVNTADPSSGEARFLRARPPAPPHDASAGLPSLEPETGSTRADKSHSPVSEGDSFENKAASTLMRAGTLFSSENATENSVNYARSVGEGLINQQVNEWLNQFGNARVSLDSDGKISGDILVPVYDSERNLFFSQLGLRNNGERDTVNAGLGYRHYVNDWMLGANVFYDYDYTGKNKRLGLGAEVWRDYLKLSANTYFRLTDWHQSPLDAMEDYDERPANGFDIRAEGYLPSWPNLGANLKYEQYFGKGVSLSDSATADDLKDNARAVTAGVTYTPFPLLTLSASRSVGDSNDSKIALDLNYRPGVPLSRQLDPDAVDLMRSLTGSRYDLVDRNYDIVMQYRKQTLLRISLPERKIVQAGDKLEVPLTVSKAKYGLESVNWTVDPALTANGGSYSVLSTTQLEVTLPPYIFKGKNREAQEYKIAAVGTDTHGNESNTAVMVLAVTPSTNVIADLTLSPESGTQPANDKEVYTATATVRDNKGMPLSGQTLTFSIRGLNTQAGKSGATLDALNSSARTKKTSGSGKVTVTTDSDGKASVTLRSKVAGTGIITVEMPNGNSREISARFVADAATARVKAVKLDGTEVHKAADGVSSFTYTVTVTDANDNPVSGVAVIPAVDKEGLAVNASGVTDESGHATVTLSGTKSAISDITVSVMTEGSTAVSADKKVSFVAGIPAQSTSAITTDTTTYIAGSTMTVKATLKDESGNAVSGQADLLTGTTVQVPNAVQAGKWADNGDGTYTAAYTAKTAGTGLKATLKLSGWSRKSESAAYDIAVGAAVADNSAITVNRARYTAGETIAVSVNLKDINGNAVTGKADLLTATTVQVPNAVQAGKWADNGDGTYTAAYTAKTAGTGLKATLKLGEWTRAGKSAAYDIAAGAAVADNSAIAVDKARYIAGETIAVKVTLKDTGGNAVSGQANTLTSNTVQVPNAVQAGKWSDGGDGTYTAAYTAQTAGTGLKATLKLDGWARAGESAAYDIAVGAAVGDNSAIAVDKTRYTAGETIAVTVTLKDTSGNGVSGMANAMTTTAVQVPNVVQAGSWADNGDGTYTASYTAQTAGTGLKATLKLDGWSRSVESATYDIAAGAAVADNSVIAVDKARYIAGETIAVKVTLKDTGGNAVSGQANTLTSNTVQVPNAVQAGKWTDGGDGTYTATYTAQIAGTGLKATLKLGGWSRYSESAAYDIAADVAVAERSAIAVDKATYTAGETLAVTVTLKDTGGNAVSGKADLLTGTTVQVPNAVLAGSWADNSDGTYTAAYTAQTAGTGLKATLKLGEWTTSLQSAAYDIAAGAAVAGNSAITLDKTDYLSGETVIVKVTLKDSVDNAVTGVADLLNASTVQVPNAVQADAWADNNDGTYTSTYTAQKAANGLKATLKLSGWEKENESESYNITLGTETPDSVNTQANPHTFNVNNENGNFPTTGFTGATFTIVPKNNRDPSDYEWKSDASWVSVKNGVVKFITKGTGNKVTITGTPKSESGNVITYSFSLKNWFINNGSTRVLFDDADKYCRAQPGYSVPTIAHLSNGTPPSAIGGSRAIGYLWGEWGNLQNYDEAGFSEIYYWASDGEYQGSEYVHYYVYSTDGSVSYLFGASRYSQYVWCREGL
ncbi:inverse autotransporter beta domain-containing protein [Salmonella enterica]|nr:inverse autotransporter beta domain-containing protein [Salmonella enterica]